MFKEYDSNTYKEKKIKDRTPFRTVLKRMWNDADFWRFWCLLWIIVVIQILFTYSPKVEAAELDVYVDESYISSQFGTYKQYAIVTDGSGNYATLYTNGKMISSGSSIQSLMSYDDFGFKTMKLEDDYLVIDDTGASYNGRSSVTISFTTGGYGLSSNMTQIIYANTDIYKTQYSNTGSPSASDEVIYSTVNNIGAKPVTPEDPEEEVPGTPSNVDLTEIIVILEEILLCLKSIFTLLSVCVFFLIAEWTANKMRNIIRRFTRYE